jgi:hypothetical protein
MLNFVKNLLENERGPMNDQDLTKTDYDPDRVSLSFSNKFSTKFSIVSNKLKFEVINSVMSGALLSVLLVCNRTILRHQVRMSRTLVRKIKQCHQH